MKHNKKSPEILQMLDRCAVDRDGFLDFLEQKKWHPEQIASGALGIDLDTAQLIYVCEDPVRWCLAFMNEPDTGEPYSFFDYQLESVRAWNQDKVHQDGAEVGKTREIVATILWAQCTGFGFGIKNPSILVGAPQQTHLDEIIAAIEMHTGEGEGFEGSKPIINKFWRKPKKHPHYMMRFKGPTCTNEGVGLVYFRPSGHDGEAYRGVHVNGLLIKDEAAKDKEKATWTEFWRAGKPGCRKHIYSVPDGDNATEYYKITQRAIVDLPQAKPGWRHFRWPKTLMPAPFWSEKRKQEYLRLYGSETDSGYQRNVLGEHGQRENTIWPWAMLLKNVREVPNYRVIKLVVSADDDTLHVEVQRIELNQVDGKKHATPHFITDRYDELAPFRDKASRRETVRNLLREFIEPVNGVFWGGADFGYSKDPTEIGLAQEVGKELKDIVRIHAEGVEYWMQCELLYCLDELFNFNAAGWGVDFGNAGTAVVQDLQNLEQFNDGDYSDRLTGFQFSAVVDCMDEDGNLLEEDDKKGNRVAVRKPSKELATELITRRLQAGTWTKPYDEEVLADYRNHTARQGARNMIFSKTDDHTIDRDRALILRKVYNDEIAAGDVFSSGVHKRSVA